MHGIENFLINFPIFSVPSMFSSFSNFLSFFLLIFFVFGRKNSKSLSGLTFYLRDLSIITYFCFLCKYFLKFFLLISSNYILYNLPCNNQTRNRRHKRNTSRNLITNTTLSFSTRRANTICLTTIFNILIWTYRLFF